MTIADRMREFAVRELIGHERLDRLDEPPLDLYRQLHKDGLANWWLPRADGGLGLRFEESVDVFSELAYGDAGAAFSLVASAAGSTLVNAYAGRELRERYIPPLAAGGGLVALAGSEHEAGSELTRMSTIARLDREEIVLNGVKAFSTNADFADFMIVFARDADQDGVFHAVLVPRHTPGLQIIKRWPVIGLRASATYQLSFTDCRVPAGNLLHGNGLRLLEAGANLGRAFMGVIALGIARRIRDLCLDYAADKPLGDGFLIDNPVFAAKLGQMEMDIEVMRNQCLAATREIDTLVANPAELLRRGTLRSAIAAKMFCGRTGWRLASTGSEMFGGLGYTEESPIGKLLRDMRHASLLEGGEDVLRHLVFSRYAVPAHRRI